MVKDRTIFEKYRSERSAELVIALWVTRHSASAVLYDTALERRFARAARFGATFTYENAAEGLCGLVVRLMRESGTPGNAVKCMGIAAPADITMAAEELLEPADMFLPPDIEIVYLPMAEGGLGGDFTAVVAAAVGQGNVIAADVNGSLRLAAVFGDSLVTANVPLKGGLDSTGLESGMPLESGAIELIDREPDDTVCYSVAGDGDSLGISAGAAMNAVRIMRQNGALDSDGIMTDRDLFYIGEDFYISQPDVRALQSDKAAVRAGLELFGKYTSGLAGFERVVISGECFGSERAAEVMAEMGAVPRGLADKYGWCRLPGEQGVINCLLDRKLLEKITALCERSEDISNRLYEDFDVFYIKNLEF